MKTKSVFLVAMSLILIALAALGGNGLEGTNIGPFNIPPFFLAFSFITASWAAYFLVQWIEKKLGAYVKARRNPWRRIVLPFVAMVCAAVFWLSAFTGGIMLTAPPENAAVWLRFIGAT